MLESDPQRPMPTRQATRLDARQVVFLKAAGVVCLGLFGALMVVFGWGGASLFALCLFGVIVAVSAVMLPAFHSHATVGRANFVTLARAGIVVFVSAAVLAPDVAPWIIFCAAVVAFAGDGIDGFLARRDGTTSAFGARFDMEVDAVLAAAVSMILLTSGTVGPAILVLGFMRYGFVAASYPLPWLNAPLPERFGRKVVCVIQIGALIALMCPIFPTAFATPVATVAVLALIWSFAVDIIWLKRAAT